MLSEGVFNGGNVKKMMERVGGVCTEATCNAADGVILGNLGHI